ncbi:hypothetical protein SLE2022_089870 [Rubroshorea leprosula]
MGVAKASPALLQHLNGGNSDKPVCWRSAPWQQRKPISLTVVCGLMLFCLGLISLFTGHLPSDLEWYSQRLVKRSFFSELEGISRGPIDIWKSEYSRYFNGCSQRGPNFASAVREQSSNGYLLIAASGGLNQQRTGITDAVVVARILNATLVVPELDHHSYWKDERLCCRVNYHASRFTKPIEELGQKLVMRMRQMAKHFIAVHLRFEPDMLAFSGCYFGGGDKERHELGEIRKRWETLPDLSADEERKRGKCPLTPHEVGLMLWGLGFANDTYVYVASGEIYGGDETLRPLRELFPNFHTKEMIANEELKPFLPYSSRLAAIDYIVCDESDVFVTNNNGNMAKILAGRRRYMGHKRTVRPNAKKLSALLMARDKMDWDTFSKKVKISQRGFMGEPDEMRPGRGEFHEYPYSCICQKPLNDVETSRSRVQVGESYGENQRMGKKNVRKPPVSLGDNDDKLTG